MIYEVIVLFDSDARKLQREYLKEWRAKNPDRVKKYNADYWRRKAEQKQMEAKHEQC